MADASNPDPAAPFWKTTALEEMSPEQWESLCDGCGRCCLVKLEEDETDRTFFTDVACFMLECHSCQCSDYPDRKRHVPDCVTLTPALVRSIEWLPPTCAYRLVADGEDLYWWHPLVSGDPETVHHSGISVRGKVTVNDLQVADGEWEDHVVRWPARVPKTAQRR
jgi:uncharacterized cysteine cluster protein YcgN (CxxCxxCC family)